MNKIKKYLKHKITYLFFKYCYQDSLSASYMMNYYVPLTLKKLDGTDIDGHFLFAQLNNRTAQYEPVMDFKVAGTDIESSKQHKNFKLIEEERFKK